MNNSVTLYKTKYTIGTIEQPYFNSTSSRDSFLLTQSPYTVNLNQPNIHFDYELNLELVLPLDYTVAQSYNLAKIVYNSKEYFAYIVDMQQLSVGQVKLILHRAVLFENVDYFSKFKNFRISKSTFADGYSYNRNTAFFKPNFRYYRKYKKIEAGYNKYYYRNEQKSLTTWNINGMVRFAVLFFSEIPARTTLGYIPNSQDYDIKNFFGCSAQYSCCFIPLKDDSNSSNLVSFDCVTSTSGDWITSSQRTEVKYYPDLKRILDLSAPFLISSKILEFPAAFSTNPIAPFFFYNEPLTFKKDEETIDVGYMLYSTSCNLSSIIDEYVSFNYNFESNFGEMRVYLYSYGNYVEIDKSLFCDGDDNGFRCSIWYFISSHGMDILPVIRPLGNESVEVNFIGTGADNSVGAIQSVMEANIDLQYILTSEANFDAQNSYYDAMTASVKNEKIVRGSLQAAGDAVLGMTQLAGAAQFTGNYSTELQTAGASNIIRGVFKAFDVAVESFYYDQQRDYNKKNEKNKPDENFGASTGLVNLFQSREVFYSIEEIPFPSDYSEWQSTIQLYGIECNLFETSLNKTTKIVGNNIFIKAIATMADDATLDAQTYNELYSFLKSGLLYNII